MAKTSKITEQTESNESILNTLIPDSETIEQQLLDLRTKIVVASVDNTLYLPESIIVAIIESSNAPENIKKNVNKGKSFKFAKWRIFQESGEMVEKETVQNETEATTSETENIKENISSAADVTQTVTCQECQTLNKYKPENPFCDKCGMKLKTKKEIQDDNKKASKKRTNILAEIAELERELEKREIIASIADHEGLDIAIKDLSQIQNNYVNVKAYKKAKEALTSLEKVNNFMGYLQDQKTECDRIRERIENLNDRLDNLQLELDLLEEIENPVLEEKSESKEKSCDGCEHYKRNRCRFKGDVCPYDEANLEEEEISEEEKEEISINAESCDPADCEDCDETECSNNPDSDDF